MNDFYEHISQKFRTYFEQYEQIDFVLIFGSIISNKFSELSDIDVAIHFKELVDLLLIGKIVSDLENISGRKIDVIELNDLYKKNPLLAYNIISKSKIINMNNFEKYTAFKRSTFLYYLDTEMMRTEFKKSFSKRIEQKMFGKRNYA